MEKGSLVRLKAPRHKLTLEDEWYCNHWHNMTPMIYVGPMSETNRMFSDVMVPEEGIHRVLHEYLTTHMRRGK